MNAVGYAVWCFCWSVIAAVYLRKDRWVPRNRGRRRKDRL